MVIVKRNDLRYEDGATERFEGIYKDYKSIEGREFKHLWNLSHKTKDFVNYYYKEFNTFEEYKKRKWRLV